MDESGQRLHRALARMDELNARPKKIVLERMPHAAHIDSYVMRSHDKGRDPLYNGYHLKRHQMDDFAKSMVNGPAWVEHEEGKCATITAAMPWKDDCLYASVAVPKHQHLLGTMMRNAVFSGELSSGSLGMGYYVDASGPAGPHVYNPTFRELSFVTEPGRADCHIIGYIDTGGDFHALPERDVLKKENQKYKPSSRPVLHSLPTRTMASNDAAAAAPATTDAPTQGFKRSAMDADMDMPENTKMARANDGSARPADPDAASLFNSIKEEMDGHVSARYAAEQAKAAAEQKAAAMEERVRRLEALEKEAEVRTATELDTVSSLVKNLSAKGKITPQMAKEWQEAAQDPNTFAPGSAGARWLPIATAAAKDHADGIQEAEARIQGWRQASQQFQQDSRSRLADPMNRYESKPMSNLDRLGQILGQQAPMAASTTASRVPAYTPMVPQTQMVSTEASAPKRGKSAQEMEAAALARVRSMIAGGHIKSGDDLRREYGKPKPAF